MATWAPPGANEENLMERTHRVAEPAAAAVAFLAIMSAPQASLASPAPPALAATPASVDHVLPFRVAAPWTAGVTNVVGGSGSFYGEGRHVGRDRYAVDVTAVRDRHADAPESETLPLPRGRRR